MQATQLHLCSEVMKVVPSLRHLILETHLYCTWLLRWVGGFACLLCQDTLEWQSGTVPCSNKDWKAKPCAVNAYLGV